MTTPTQLVSGLAGAIGSDFRPTHAQLLFVEFGGKLSRLNLFRSATQVSSGNAILKGTFTFDLENGNEGGMDANYDLWWDQETATARQMVPWKNARLVNLGVVDFKAITPDNLQHLTYSTTPINGSNNASNKLVPGDVFAVLTNQGNYSKVKILSYGYNLTIQWVTYHLDPAYKVLGSGYTQPEDVKVSADDAHAYVTERSGALLRVALNNANRPAATVVSSGMTAPHQIVLDEAHNAAYVSDFDADGHVWRVDLTSGDRTAVVSGLEFPVGLALSSDLQFAYVSEQTTGADKGRVSRIQLSNGARQVLATGLTAPFFLTWADAAQTSLLVPERDPANRILSINVATGSVNVVANAVPARPSSVALAAPGDMLVCSDQVIEELNFSLGSFQPAGPLLMSIGSIPFDKVTASGLADTTVDPAYFYQVKDTPFGGTLPLMVNHLRAFNEGAAYYRVKVDGSVRSDTWTDEKWNGTTYVGQPTAPTMVAGQPGYYPVHSLSELFLWVHPALGSMLDSTNLTNAPHTIDIEFVNGAGTVVDNSTSLTILVNNQSCVATISPPVLNGNSADSECGVLTYAAKNDDPVVMDFTATHPAGFGTFAFIVVKGVNQLTLPAVPPTSGAVPASPPIEETVKNLLGDCTVAGFAEHVYVWATANNGWWRQSQYDGSALIAFVLSP